MDPALSHSFAALADPTRLAVVDLLRTRPHRAGELAQALAMSAPALSRHLRVLRKSGIIADDALADDARVKLYRLDHDAFQSLRDWLDEVEMYWTGQLEGFRQYAEGAGAGNGGNAVSAVNADGMPIAAGDGPPQ